MPKLEELHKAYMASKEIEENYNFDDHKPKIEENEFNTWQPVAKDIEFEKHITKLAYWIGGIWAWYIAKPKRKRYGNVKFLSQWYTLLEIMCYN